MLTKDDLKVLVGGEGKIPLPYVFTYGEVTDTRLMGVLGMHLHYTLYGYGDEKHLHLFFYYDVEELGLDAITTYSGNDSIAVEIAGEAAFGGLGAKMTEITEREATYLVKFFVSETERMGQKLPKEIKDINFILEREADLSEPEIAALNKKMCVKMSSNNARVHYFLMRLFGHDTAGAKLLAAPELDMDKALEIQLPAHATFLKSTVRETMDESFKRLFLTESLVESEDTHYMIFSELEIKDGLISKAVKKSSFKITDSEAGMMLNKAEYISVYEVNEDHYLFDLSFTAFAIGTTVSTHENGNMYMEFKRTNDHVENRTFNLNDDIEALYFVSVGGQLIVASYSEEGIVRAEQKLAHSSVRSEIYPTNKYKFLDSVLYDFAQSDFDDFNEYVNLIEV